MELLDKYEKMSKELIDNSKIIKEFNCCLNENLDKVYNFKLNKSIFYKLIHPVKTIRNNENLKSLILIRKKYNKIYDDSILLYIKEENGEIEEDLEYAAKVVKLNYIENETRFLIKKINHFKKV